MLQLPLNIQLDDSARYSNFFIGNNEQLVTRISSIKKAYKNQFVFIWGCSQSGKTHLAQALCNSLDNNDMSAIYLPLKNKDLNCDILAGISSLDVICIDDFEHIAGLNQWEEAFFNLYNQLKIENKSLIIFSECSPSNIQLDIADLKSRLMAMEVYKIEMLNELEKKAFLQQRAAGRGLDINDEVAKFILTRQSRSILDLVNMIEQLDRSSIALQRKITIPFVKQIFNL